VEEGAEAVGTVDSVVGTELLSLAVTGLTGVLEVPSAVSVKEEE
jgi:hypothetical protein